MGGVVSDSFLENGIIIDVRSQGEWDEGHIDGAVLIPHTQIKSKIEEYVKDKDAPINLYCASGMRASTAKSTLQSMGYTKVANLGGFSSAKSKIPKK